MLVKVLWDSLVAHSQEFSFSVTGFLSSGKWRTPTLTQKGAKYCRVLNPYLKAKHKNCSSATLLGCTDHRDRKSGGSLPVKLLVFLVPVSQ